MTREFHGEITYSPSDAHSLEAHGGIAWDPAGIDEQLPNGTVPRAGCQGSADAGPG